MGKGWLIVSGTQDNFSHSWDQRKYHVSLSQKDFHDRKSGASWGYTQVSPEDLTYFMITRYLEAKLVWCQNKSTLWNCNISKCSRNFGKSKYAFFVPTWNQIHKIVNNCFSSGTVLIMAWNYPLKSSKRI